MTGRLIDEEWCTDCKEYDTEHNCCHRFNKVIRQTVEDLKAEYIPIEWLESHYPPAVNHDSVAYITKATVVEELIREYRSERKDA